MPPVRDHTAAMEAFSGFINEENMNARQIALMKYPKGAQRRSRHLWAQPPLLLLQGRGYRVS